MNRAATFALAGVVIIAGGAYLLYPEEPFVHPLPLIEGDTVASWDFVGAYTSNEELVAKAQAEIARLKKGGDEYTPYIYFVSIANQYELMGDGAYVYEYLGRAAALAPDTGLAWYNLGVLMERLHAYRTALVAYQSAAFVQELTQYVERFEEFKSQHPELAS